MSGHTPGPWICDGATFEFEGARFGEAAYVLSKEGEQFPVNAANARVIATAPKLLAVLEEELEALCDDIRWAHDCDLDRLIPRRDRIEAVIAKATAPPHQREHGAVSGRELVEAQGFVLVPREPTAGMLKAAWRTFGEGATATEKWNAVEIWSAMIAAALRPTNGGTEA